MYFFFGEFMGGYFNWLSWALAVRCPSGNDVSDSSPANNDMKLLNMSSSAWVNGKFGGGLSIDGIDDEVRPKVNLLNIYKDSSTSNFSMSIWVKTSEVLSNTNSNYTSGLVIYPEHGGTSTYAGAGLAVGVNGANVQEHGGSYTPVVIAHSQNVGVGWNHYTVTYTSNTPRLYLNGTLVKIGTQSSRLAYPTSPCLGGGAWAPTWADKMATCDVDEFRIYSRSLSSTDVNEVYTWLPSPPSITSNGGGGSANKNVSENQTVATTVSATDPDAGTTITYSISGGVDSSKFNINGSTGVLSFTTPPNFESPTDLGANNSYVVNVRASDGQLYDEQTITFTVNNVNESPSISSNGGGGTASKNFSENQTGVTTVSATDPDAGTTLTYTISGGVDAGKFQINGNTGALSFKTAPNYESPTDSGANNSYVVKVRASDGALHDEQTITVNLTNVNEHPMIGSNGGGDSAIKNAPENQTGVTTVSATDPDAGTTLTYTISGGVDAGKFQINGNTGALSFKAAPNYESPTDSGANNSYVVKVRASDGALHDEQTITVNLTNVNEHPMIGSNGGGDSAIKNAPENQTGVTTVSATDPDAGTTLTYTISGGVDAGKFQINGNTGALSFKAAPNYESPTDSGANNSYVVKVHASDGALHDEQTITVNLTNVNDAPDALFLSNFLVTENQSVGSLIGLFSASDEDGLSDLQSMNFQLVNTCKWRKQ